MISRLYKMCVWGAIIDTLLDRLQDQFAAFMSEKGVDALIIEVCVVVTRRLLCERQVGRDGGKERETARARMDARARTHTHTHTHTGNQALFDAVTRQGHDKYVRFLSSLGAWLK